MRTTRDKTPWDEAERKVKTLESLSAGGGSKLALFAEPANEDLPILPPTTAQGRPATTELRWLTNQLAMACTKMSRTTRQKRQQRSARLQASAQGGDAEI